MAGGGVGWVGCRVWFWNNLFGSSFRFGAGVGAGLVDGVEDASSAAVEGAGVEEMDPNRTGG